MPGVQGCCSIQSRPCRCVCAPLSPLSRANLFVQRGETQDSDFRPIPVPKKRSNMLFEAFFELTGEKREKTRAHANFQACLLSDSSTWSKLQMSKEPDLACCGLQPLASMPSFASPMVQIESPFRNIINLNIIFVLTTILAVVRILISISMT